MARKKKNYDNDTCELFARYMDYYENIACSIFKWTGLPEGVRSTWIEKKLWEYGAMCMADNVPVDEFEGLAPLLILPMARGGRLNALFEPTRYWLITPRKNIERTINDAVLLRNNELMIPTREEISKLVWELADIRAAMRVNRNAAAKTPAIFSVTEERQLTALNKYNKICGNEPIILQDPSAPVSQIADQKPPYWGAELREEFENVEAEILTRIGVISNPIRKAERVNTVESMSNRGEIVDNLDTKLQMRQLFCEQANEKFKEVMNILQCGPINVEVNNQYTKEMIEQGIEEKGEGGEIDDRSKD